ncbi:uncharacterized protein TNCV_4073511 [Trichonephila clavipes]|uniref:Uncharacterized protein n=1 Tax=Trichonephila clavipes TaxID=2585209 RepID=A0A8X6W806_TRICX|nr:uncharacterized protein TNCV_4073511 [Trichonephila clavipes]
MDVCKCIVPSRHGGTLNSRRAASSLERLMKGGERWEASDHPHGVLQNWGGIKLRIVLSPEWCSRLWLTTGYIEKFNLSQNLEKKAFLPSLWEGQDNISF